MYCNQDIRAALMEKFKRSGFIDVTWNVLVRYLENKNLCEHLKIEVLNKWVNAFVKKTGC